MERVGRQPPPDSVHAQSEGHADTPQGLLRDEQLEAQRQQQEREARVPPTLEDYLGPVFCRKTFQGDSGKSDSKALCLKTSHHFSTNMHFRERRGRDYVESGR